MEFSLEKAPLHAVGGEVVTNADIADAMYEKYDLDSLLGDFAHKELREGDVEPTLMAYANDVSMLAFRNSKNIDVDLVRKSFERLKTGYDSAGHTETFKDKVLRMAGRPVTPRSRVRQLDDRYWEEQFPREFAEQTSPNVEATLEDFQRYVSRSMKGLSWAYFTMSV